MLHRTLYQALKDGVTELTDNPSLLETVFAELYCLGVDEIATILELWKAKPPFVTQSYARTDSTFPLYAIVLLSENDDQDFIGDEAGWDDNPESSTFGANIEAKIWSHAYQILVYSEHPDATAWYYEIAKIILQRASGAFAELGFFDIALSGAELMPDPRFAPEHLFVRQMTFKAKRKFEIAVPGQQRGFTLQGIHVDSPSDSVEDVQRNVTVYLDGDG